MNYQNLKYIYHPSTVQASYTLLLLHGTGGNETDLLPLAERFGKNVNILSVRGNVSEHGMPRFFKRLGMGIFDEEDLAYRTEELVRFLSAVAKKENFDATKVIALGYSNGANIAGSVLVKHPDLLVGAILFRPMQPYKELPNFNAKNAVPVFLSSGKLDPTVDSNSTESYVKKLNAGGFVTTAINLNTSHNLTQEDITQASRWFNENFSAGNI